MKCTWKCYLRGHLWVDNFVYRVFHSDSPRFQLMCERSGTWVNVKQPIFERYVTMEMHREQKEE